MVAKEQQLLHLGAVVRAFRAGARLPRDTQVGRH